MIIKPIIFSAKAAPALCSVRVESEQTHHISPSCCFYKKLILREDKSEWLEQQICEERVLCLVTIVRGDKKCVDTIYNVT